MNAIPHSSKRRLLLEEYALAAIILVQVVLVCLGVLSRYAFNWSLSFTEELTRYLLIWLACLGFPACCARRETIRFQYPGRKPRWFELTIRWVTLAASAVFFIVLLFTSLKMIHLQWRYDQTTSVMGWPIVWVSLSLPVTSLLYTIRMLQNKPWRTGSSTLP